MDSWNGLDFIIFLIFVLNTVLGMVRGATKEIMSMICLSAALIIMIKFTVPLTGLFNSSPVMADVVDNGFIRNFMLAINAGPLTIDLLKQVFYSLSTLVCFVGAFSICEAALTRTGFQESYSFPYAALSSKLGAALGCTRGYVITLIFLLVSTHIFSGTAIGNEFLSGSYFANLFQSSTAKLDGLIIGQRPEKYKEIFEGKDLYNQEQIFKQLKTDQLNMDQLKPLEGDKPAQ